MHKKTAVRKKKCKTGFIVTWTFNKKDYKF